VHSAHLISSMYYCVSVTLHKILYKRKEEGEDKVIINKFPAQLPPKIGVAGK